MSVLPQEDKKKKGKKEGGKQAIEMLKGQIKP